MLAICFIAKVCIELIEDLFRTIHISFSRLKIVIELKNWNSMSLKGSCLRIISGLIHLDGRRGFEAGLDS